jgi:hypothetical protein
VSWCIRNVSGDHFAMHTQSDGMIRLGPGDHFITAHEEVAQEARMFTQLVAEPVRMTTEWFRALVDVMMKFDDRGWDVETTGTTECLVALRRLGVNVCPYHQPVGLPGKHRDVPALGYMPCYGDGFHRGPFVPGWGYMLITGNEPWAVQKSGRCTLTDVDGFLSRDNFHDAVASAFRLGGAEAVDTLLKSEGDCYCAYGGAE